MMAQCKYIKMILCYIIILLSWEVHLLILEAFSVSLTRMYKQMIKWYIKKIVYLKISNIEDISCFFSHITAMMRTEN